LLCSSASGDQEAEGGALRFHIRVADRLERVDKLAQALLVGIALLAGVGADSSASALPGPHGVQYVYNDPWRGWPVAPLDQQHPIRGSFLDPRPGGYHIGIDINVRDDQPEPGAPLYRSHRVYAVESGTVSFAPGTPTVGCASRRLEVGHFSYWHTDPIGVVTNGQSVSPGDHIGWTCTNLWHVHLSEWQLVEGIPVWVNPLHDGGKLAPFADTAAPLIRALRFSTPALPTWILENGAISSPNAGTELSAANLRGLVDVRALIGDPQSFVGWFASLPALYADHHPQRVRLEIERAADGALVLARDTFDAEVYLGAPLPTLGLPVPFDYHYAPGTRQNLGAKPCLDLQPRVCSGEYWLRLFAGPADAYWDTTRFPNGRYRLRITAWDASGNQSAATAAIAIDNPVPAPPPPQLPPPPQPPAPPPAGPPRARLTLTVTRFATTPKLPKAGKRFAASVRVYRSDTAGLLVSGKLACPARSRSRGVAAVAKVFRRGLATCVWRIPRAARGRPLAGSVTVAYGRALVRRPFAFRIR
jgi:hypothetical protein